MRLILLSTILLGLVACVTEPGNRQAIDRQARALNSELRSEASVENVQVQGRTFRVAIVEGSYARLATDTTLEEFVLGRDEDPYALVTVLDGSRYRAGDIEAAARSASGCNAAFNGGVLATLTGNLRSSDLAELEGAISNFNGWRVDLAC